MQGQKAPFGRYLSANVKLALLLAFISIAVYANSLRNGFALDDFDVIAHNTFVKQGFSGISELISSPYHHGVPYQHENNLYRPLSMAFFAVEYALFGESTFPYHLVNILMFSFCVQLLFRFLQRLFSTPKPGVAFIAALIFAVHPVHTEVVANIKGQDELLCFLFAFLALDLFSRYIRNGKLTSLVPGALCFLLSLMCKESSVTFLVIIPMFFYSYCYEKKSRTIIISLLSLAAVAVFIGIRAYVLTKYETTLSEVTFLDNQLVNAPSYASRLATAVLIAGHYIKLLFVPYPLYYDYSYNAIPFAQPTDTGVVISFVVYLGLLVFAIYRLLRFRSDPYAFSILYYLITISLFLNIFFLIGSNMGERFLFLPSVGFCLMFALVVEKINPTTGYPLAVLKNLRTWFLLGPIVVIFASLTINRNAEWLDNFTLYYADSKKSSNSWRIYFHLATEYCKNLYSPSYDSVSQRPLTEEGIKNFRKSLAILPNNENEQARMANAFLSLNDVDSAIEHFNIALRISPNSKIVIQKLSYIYFYRGDYRKALELFRRQFDVNHDEHTYGNIGVCYLKLTKYDSAIVIFSNLLAKNPRNISVNQALADTYRGIGYADSVSKYERIVGQLTNR